MYYSVIIAIYNRKEELKELLNSLVSQIYKDFEVIVVDDGSQEDLRPIVHSFEKKLELHYHKKENSGPGLTRNFGAQYAQGDYLIFVDSDCILPQEYLENINQNLLQNPVEAFGGNDKAHDDFNAIQKAISYSMTSMLTTGGIRGKKKALTRFQPRSFNMGILKNVFDKVGGFSDLRIGEDPDLSLRLWKNGYKTSFFNNIGVFHKRRNTLKSFAKQVYQFGIARPILNQRHPEFKKLVFWFPTLFYIGFLLSLVLSIIYIIWPYSPILYVPLLLVISYFVLIFIDSSIKNKSLKVGFWSIITSFIQLSYYGAGFLKSWWQLNILHKDPKKTFPTHYYS